MTGIHTSPGWTLVHFESGPFESDSDTVYYSGKKEHLQRGQKCSLRDICELNSETKPAWLHQKLWINILIITSVWLFIRLKGVNSTILVKLK